MDATNARTILLVEDEENDVVFIEMALEKAGLASAFHVAEDGEEAIAYLSGRASSPIAADFPCPRLSSWI